MSNYLFQEPGSDSISESELNSATTQVSMKPSSESSQSQFSSESHATFAENLAIQNIIGEGAVGRVYLAYDKAIGRRVAVKELLKNPLHQNLSEQERQQLERSFIHEAKITGKLEHPGIIPVYQLGYHETGTAYYVMRYVKGETLEEKLTKCQKSKPEQAVTQRLKLLDTLIDACDAIAYAHSKGVIHRDLKPSNIIGGKFGETIILDWGLAQALEDGDEDFFNTVQNHQQHTYSDSRQNSSVGTLRYMAPEQLSGKASRASDVYSLGVVLFKIITGYLPYKGNNHEIEAQLLSNAPSPSPNRYLGTISPELGAICEKAMAKNPDDRFRDAGELAYQLKAYRDGRMVNIYSYSKQELFRRFLAKNKLLVAMLGVLFIAIVVGSVFSVHYAIQMDKARAQAEKALVSVTALGDQAQAEANDIAAAINTGITALFADMKKTASLLNNPAQKNPPVQELLQALHTQYPDFTSFTIENSQTLPVNLGWKTEELPFNAPIMIKENGKLMLMFLVPLQKQGQAVNYLTAKVFPDRVLPKFFPIGVSTSQPKDIWLMLEDGLVFYDKEEKYRGTNIFTDTINNESPSVVAFGHLIIDRPYGISYYSFSDLGKKISKIAAWKTIDFNEKKKSWKIIVDYTYMTSPNE